MTSDSKAISLRRGLLLIFVIGAMVLLAIRLFYRNAIILRLFRLTMLAFVLGGIVGLWFHLSSNMEFELEMYPTLTGLELLSKALGGAMPALAPGALVQLGLIGFLYTYQHPALSREQTKEN